MLRKFGSHLRDQWIGTTALFLVLAGGTAYAANTIVSTDIVNNEVYGADVRDDTLAGGGLGHVDLKPGSVRSSEVAADSLAGADINESALSTVPSAANANTLDGKDSSEFAPAEAYVRGTGRVVPQALAVQPGANTFLGPPMAGFLRLSYFCPSPTSNTGFLWVYNDSGSVANVFVDNGESNPTYRQMAAGANFFVPANPAGEAYSIQAQGALGIQTIQIATANRAGDCHAQAQAVLAS